MDNWSCWICGENQAVEWWANPEIPKQYAICGKCKPMFMNVVVNRKETNAKKRRKNTLKLDRHDTL